MAKSEEVSCLSEKPSEEMCQRSEDLEIGKNSSVNGTIKKSSSLNRISEGRGRLDILNTVAGDGHWQRWVFLVMLIATIPGATHNLSMTFLAPEIDYWCAKPAEAEVSIEEWKTYGLPEAPKEKKCNRYENWTYALSSSQKGENRSEYKIVSCESWNYDDTLYTSTVISEWNLVCANEWLVSLSKSLFMLGILVGVSVFGVVSDKFGRRPTCTACCFLMVLSAILCTISVNFPMFIFARFLIAVGFAGYYITLFVLLMEVCGPELRSIYGMAVQFGYSIGFVCLPGIAYVIRDWFWIQVALTVPCFALIGIWWTIPESPRWLLSQGRIEEASKILNRAAKANKVEFANLDIVLSKLMEEASNEYKSGETEGSVIDLFITPGLWKITLNIYFLWFVNAFVYFGLSFNTNDLDGDPFVNFALSGAVEFPAYLLSIFALMFFGRKRPLAAIMVTAGISCILAYALPEEPGWPTVIVSMIGKFCITSSFGIVYIYTTELFPTVVRNAGLGSAAFCEGIGSILAPFTKELGEATHPVFPLVLIGILSFISGVLVLLLPETHNQIVPNTLKEAAMAYKKNNNKASKNGLKISNSPVDYAKIASPENKKNMLFESIVP